MQYKRLGFTLFKFLSPTVHITTQFKLLKDNGYLINGEVILCFQFSYHYHLPHFFSLHSWFLIPFFLQFFFPSSSQSPCAYCLHTFTPLLSSFHLFCHIFSLFLWLLHSSVDAGTSIRERRSCVPAPFATGTPQYLIRSAFV